MSQFEDATTYFGSFRDSRLEEYQGAMGEYRVGKNTGYGPFPGSSEVVQTLRDIFHNLEETFDDLRVPERFVTQAALLQAWRNFRDYLETKGERFRELRPEIIADAQRSVIGDPAHFSDEDFLPEPYLYIDRVRQDVLDAVNETLALAEPPPAPGGDPPDVRLTRLLERFHRIALQLRRRHDDRATLTIGDEYDVQDLLHALLKSEFEDVRVEDYAPQYAGGASRIDFVLPLERMAIEVKKTRATLKDKQVGEELIIDIARYRSDTRIATLHCFVYDPDGHIQNPAGLKRDLEALSTAPLVRVTIVPQH